MKSTIKVEIFNKNIIKREAKIISFNDIKNRKITNTNRKVAEIALWKAVIMQSVLDLMNTSKRSEEILAKRSATIWLNKDNAGFIEVCAYAGLDPDWVLKKVNFAIKNPLTWRRECDLKKYFLQMNKGA